MNDSIKCKDNVLIVWLIQMKNNLFAIGVTVGNDSKLNNFLIFTNETFIWRKKILNAMNAKRNTSLSLISKDINWSIRETNNLFITKIE